MSGGGIQIIHSAAHARMPDGSGYSQLLPRDAVAAPFSSGLVIVPPHTSTWRHNHHDREVFVFVSGRARLEWDGDSQDVGPGDVAIIWPFVAHSVVNLADSTDVVFLTLWWNHHDDYVQAAARRASGLREPPGEDVFLVSSALPTPNGALHLGHLAGPYLAADVVTRGLRQAGYRAFSCSGVDEHQTYVPLAAGKIGQPPEAFLETMVQSIRGGLTHAGVRHDVFLRPSRDAAIEANVALVFHTLLERGVFELEQVAVPCDPASGAPLVEAHLSGACAWCCAAMSGTFCEGCASFVPEDRVRDARSSLTGERALYRECRRVVLRLERHRAMLANAMDRMAMTGNVKRFLARLLAKPLPDVPVTHTGTWGQCTEYGRLYTYIDEPAFLLSTLDALDLREHAARVRPIYFFGMDNAFIYAVLTPVLLAAFDDRLPLPAVLHGNEFYLLEGSKFSTSRGHVLDAKALAPVPMDWIRLYLAATRPELRETDFRREVFSKEVRMRRAAWGAWLRDLCRRVRFSCGGVVPEAGRWTERHLAFFAELDAIAGAAARALAPACVSLPDFVASLDRLIATARELAHAEPCTTGTETLDAESRTTIALELAAGRQLGVLAAPLMPDLSEALGEALGLGASLARTAWSDARQLLTPGLPVCWEALATSFEEPS